MEKEVSKLVDIILFKMSSNRITKSWKSHFLQHYTHLEESLDAKIEHVIKQLATKCVYSSGMFT